MAETFLILFAAGIMLAAAISGPRQVTVHWLRLCGIIALCLAVLSLYFCWHERLFGTAPVCLGATVCLMGSIVLILGQLAFVQMERKGIQRGFAAAAAAAAASAGALMIGPGTGPAWLEVLRVLAVFAAAAVTGLALMDMLLGHAYLTASKMTMAPFVRLNASLGIALVVRTVLAVAACLLVAFSREPEMFWSSYLLYIGTRFVVGLLVPGVFVYMAYDCIRRRATQSATGILYVAGVLIFIGEIVALYLIRETQLPF